MTKRLYSIRSRAKLIGDMDTPTPNDEDCFVWDTVQNDAMGDIDAASGGVMSPRLEATFDISKGISNIIGKQAPMTATYRVKGIQVRLVNSDLGIDNDRGGMFYGTCEYYSPNVHNIDCIQAHRTLERNVESTQIDMDSMFLPTHDNYQGFRFGWNRQGEVHYPTTFVDAHGVQHGLSLDEMKARYELVLHQGEANLNRLWGSRFGNPSKLLWSADMDLNITNGDVGSNQWEFSCPEGNHLDILGGLLRFTVEGSSIQETLLSGDLTDDDFFLEAAVLVEGWSTW